MTPKQVQRRYLTIKKRENKLYEQLKELQSICEHTNVNKVYKGDTGNYDPGADIYWIEWRCPDCGKFWITEQ